MSTLPPSVSGETWNVGFQRIGVADPVGDETLAVALWYPTESSEAETTIGPARLSLAVDAEPVESIAGLVLISHGFSGSLLGHSDMAQYLARNGYLVVTPTHPDREGLATGDPMADPLVARPRHLRVVVDQLIDDPDLGKRVDKDHTGIVGFSLGGYSALVALGAQPELAELEDYCQENGADWLLCSAASRARLDSLESHTAFRSDGRLSAAVLLAPAYGPLFSTDSLARIKTPVLVFGAGEDEELDNRFNAEPIAAALPGSVEPIVIDGAGHFVFMAPCPPAIAADLPALCRDSDGVDRAAVHERVNAEILAFFRRVWS
jgi:predicted dienelactone hydrolase